MLRAFFSLFSSVPAESKELLASIRAMTGVRPADPNIYLAAFRRKVDDQSQKSANMRYERLEYLGDAVLGVLMAEYLYDKYPKGDEGYLTSMRSKVVSRKALNRIAVKMGIPEWMQQSSRGRRIGTTSVPGNTLEALVGAVYVDKGWNATKIFVHKRLLDAYVNFDRVEKEVISYKSLLIEWVQRQKKTFEFEVLDENGAEQRKRFTMCIKIDGEVQGEGSGQSKKIAEEAASRAACKALNLGRREPSRPRRGR
ncbi:MAG: ribonuclease III domain-containing protein [Schleiferiaceae bacterium]|nr:ribonuclease III domain-containing protein [Schleiferiaceae bacterium]